MSADEQHAERPIITRSEAKTLGLKRYFTGKPCKRGHVAERNVCARECVDCGNESTRRRFRQNPEKFRKKFRESQRRHRAQNPERAREQNGMKNAKIRIAFQALKRLGIIINIERNPEETSSQHYDRKRRFVYRALKRLGVVFNLNLSGGEGLS